MTWADGLLCPFDIESTGVDVETDRLVTATVIQVRAGHEVVPEQWLADPGIEIPADATAIHGITTEFAREHGRDAAEVVAAVWAALRAGWAAGGIVVGHNLAYDLTMLDREHRRHHGRPIEIMGPIADSYVLDKWADKYRKGSRKLTATAEHYQVRLDAAHDAVEDALASARILWRMTRWYPQLGAMHPRDDLYPLQRRAKREQCESLQDHFRAKARDAGKTAEEIEAIVIDPHWPIAPLPTTTAATTASTEPTGATS